MISPILALRFVTAPHPQYPESRSHPARVRTPARGPAVAELLQAGPEVDRREAVPEPVPDTDSADRPVYP